MEKKRNIPQIMREYPRLKKTFVTKYVRIAREGQAAANGGVVDTVALAADRPRPGRPRYFNTAAKQAKLKAKEKKKKAKKKAKEKAKAKAKKAAKKAKKAKKAERSDSAQAAE